MMIWLLPNCPVNNLQTIPNLPFSQVRLRYYFRPQGHDLHVGWGLVRVGGGSKVWADQNTKCQKFGQSVLNFN